MKKITSIFTILFWLLFVCWNIGFAEELADGFQFPLRNYVIGGNVLGSYNVIGNQQYHLGEDAQASATTNVYAIANGKIRHAKNHPARYDSVGNLIRNYGGMYVIEHTLPSR